MKWRPSPQKTPNRGTCQGKGMRATSDLEGRAFQGEGTAHVKTQWYEEACIKFLKLVLKESPRDKSRLHPLQKTSLRYIYLWCWVKKIPFIYKILWFFYRNMMRFEKLHTAFIFPLKNSHSMFKCLQVPELSLCCFSLITWTSIALGFRQTHNRLMACFSFNLLKFWERAHPEIYVLMADELKCHLQTQFSEQPLETSKWKVQLL